VSALFCLVKIFWERTKNLPMCRNARKICLYGRLREAALVACDRAAHFFGLKIFSGKFKNFLGGLKRTKKLPIGFFVVVRSEAPAHGPKNYIIHGMICQALF